MDRRLLPIAHMPRLRQILQGPDRNCSGGGGARWMDRGTSRSTMRARMHDPGDVSWSATINVPFSPETPASGIGDTGLFRACWYRRRIDVPPPIGTRLARAVAFWRGRLSRHGVGQRLDGRLARRRLHAVHLRHHRGRRRRGDAARSSCAPKTIRSISRSRAASRIGWLEPHSIWYPRTTGIWQTVWLERVPADVDRRDRAGRRTWSAGKSAAPYGRAGLREARRQPACQADARRPAARRGHLLRHRRRSAPPHCALRSRASTIHATSCCGIPARPRLIDAESRSSMPTAASSIASTATRRCAPSRSMAIASFSTAGPYALRLVLDQGYWPESGMTAPDDDGAAARRGARQGDGLQRRPQAPEDRRSALPLLGRPPRPAGLGGDAERVSLHHRVDSAHHARMDGRDHARLQPSVHHRLGAFNESWGVPNLPNNPAERHYVRGLYSPDQDARSDAARGRQRRLGERGHRHHRHSRLRSRSAAARHAAITPTKCCRGCSGANGPAAARWCSKASGTPINR